MAKSLAAFAILIALVACLTAAFAPLSGTFDMSWHTIDGGGGISSGSGFDLHGTIGQHDAGATLAGGGFSLTGGFWYGGAPESVVAALTDAGVFFGTHISGGLAEVLASDNTFLRARSSFGFTSAEPNVVEVRVGAQSPLSAPATIDLTVEGRINQSGGTSKLRLRNWSTNAFQQVHQYSIGTTEIVEQVMGIAAANRVRSTDQRIELSIRQSVVIVFSSAGFDSFTDWVEVRVE